MEGPGPSSPLLILVGLLCAASLLETQAGCLRSESEGAPPCSQREREPRLPRFPNGWDKDSTAPRIPGDACIFSWQKICFNPKCYKIQPTWMGDRRDFLLQRPLAAVIFFDRNTYYGRRWAIEDNEKLIVNTNEEVWAYLVLGGRYFQLNLAYVNEHTNLDGTENSLSKKPTALENIRDNMLSTFGDIKEFLKKSPNEILVLDIVSFPKATNEYFVMVHRMLHFVYAVLGEYIIPPYEVSRLSTCGDVWKTGRNIILTMSGVNSTSWYEAEEDTFIPIRGIRLPLARLQEYFRGCFHGIDESALLGIRYQNLNSSIAFDLPAGNGYSGSIWSEKFSFEYDDNKTVITDLVINRDAFPMMRCANLLTTTEFVHHNNGII